MNRSWEMSFGTHPTALPWAIDSAFFGPKRNFVPRSKTLRASKNRQVLDCARASAAFPHPQQFACKP